MKTLILTILFSITLFAQSRIIPFSTRPGGSGVGTTPDNFIPDVVYADTAITATTGSTVLTFTHGGIAANRLLTVWLVKEKATVTEGWTTSAISESGWTRAFDITRLTTHDVGIAMFWKIATGTESGNFTATGTESKESAGFYIVFDSVDTSNPINIVGDTTNWDATTAVLSQTVEQCTTNVNNCLAVAWWGMYNTDNFDEADTMYVTGTGWAMSPTAGISTGLVTNRFSAFTAGGMMAMRDVWTAGGSGAPTFHFGWNTTSGGIGRIVGIRGDNIPDSLETAGTVLWLESDSGVTKDANNKVTAWADISDANHDYAQADTSKSPTWSSDGLAFDGTDDVMRLTWTQAQPYTIYIVAKPVAWAAGDYFWAGAATDGFAALQMVSPTPKVRLGISDDAIDFDTTTAYTIGNYHISVVVGNTTSSIHKVDDDYSWSGTKDDTEIGGLTIAASEAGTGNFGKVTYKVIIIRKYADNEATQTAIINYLNNKYSVY